MTEPLLPEGTPLHELSMPIRWGDMDALNHVNNTVYFRYFEQTRLGWYEALGLPSLAVSDEGMIIVDNHAEYLRPLVYPADITVHMGGHSPGRSSFVSTYSIVAGNTLFTRGRAKIVWVDHKAGKSTPLPVRIRELFNE